MLEAYLVYILGPNLTTGMGYCTGITFIFCFTAFFVFLIDKNFKNW